MKMGFSEMVIVGLIVFGTLAVAAGSASAEELPLVMVVTTGGTIAEKTDAAGGSVPAVSGKDLVAAVPGLDKIARVQVEEFSNIDSSHMTPEIWRRLSARVNDILRGVEVAGVVVTHGTDTLADGAFFLDLTVRSEKPVVFVGAMRNASDLSPDGPANLYNAVLLASREEGRRLGVVICMNQYIIAARFARKVQTTNVQAFSGGEHGYLGYVLGDRVIRLNAPPPDRQLPLPEELPDVPLITTYPGDDGRLIRAAVDGGARGLVVEALGAGNVNPATASAIEFALGKKIPVVIVSRVEWGGTFPLYGDVGGGLSLEKAGAILSPLFDGSKARLLLMLALARPENRRPPLRPLFSGEPGGERRPGG